ncbi:MAG: hypothetical protein TU35_004895 [Thermoproteus sp. AZ2]|jgi:RNase P subunit RPR2|uniref:Uncharacterized protein n=1 Tax=Thermoproteus sp. AZ2 TaxID=1609232 RepID=A0ACC6V0I1_9CREN|nr:MAG: Zn finger protein [Thermoproteus sp. AZ2]
MGDRKLGTVVCPNCKRPVKPKECGRRALSKRYVVVTYCCPRCGAELLTEHLEVAT